MSKGPYLPLELLPEWLIESPITFDDLRPSSPPATLFRISLPPTPLDRRNHRHVSIVSFTSTESKAMSTRSHRPEDLEPEPLQSSSSFLWCGDEDEDEDCEPQEEDRERDDDEATLNELAAAEDRSLIDPFFIKPDPESNSRVSSFDYASPWFMHFDAAALSVLDNQLLQFPVDAFADMCYAQAVQLQDASAAPGSYSWRRFSRLRPLSPFSEEEEALDEEEDSESSDSDSEQLASPDQQTVRQSWSRPQIYSPTPPRDMHHPTRLRPHHYHQGSDGSIHFRTQVISPTALFSQTSKPLPFLPPPSPSTPTSLSGKDLRSATASPPPLFLPSPAVSQAQLAFLFGSPPNPSESVHFFPAIPPQEKGNAYGKGRPRRRPLKNSAASNMPAHNGTWFQRGLAGIRSGFSAGP